MILPSACATDESRSRSTTTRCPEGPEPGKRHRGSFSSGNRSGLAHSWSYMDHRRTQNRRGHSQEVRQISRWPHSWCRETSAYFNTIPWGSRRRRRTGEKGRRGLIRIHPPRATQPRTNGVGVKDQDGASSIFIGTKRSWRPRTWLFIACIWMFNIHIRHPSAGVVPSELALLSWSLGCTSPETEDQAANPSSLPPPPPSQCAPKSLQVDQFCFFRHNIVLWELRRCATDAVLAL